MAKARKEYDTDGEFRSVRFDMPREDYNRYMGLLKKHGYKRHHTNWMLFKYAVDLFMKELDELNPEDPILAILEKGECKQNIYKKKFEKKD